MLSYHPGETYAHRLDPRVKLGFQAAFGIVAIAHDAPIPLLVLTVLALVALRLSGTAPARALWAYRYALPFLLLAPVVSGVSLASPWIDLDRFVTTLLASYAIALILLTSAVYVRSTPVRESQAAIAWLIPGRTGRLLATGVSSVFRLLPLLIEDLREARAAHDARLGTERPVHVRMSHLALSGIARSFSRADHLSLALRARCFSWNATLPGLRMRAADGPVMLVSGLLIGSLFL